MLDPAIESYYTSAPEERRLEFGPGKLEEVRTRELILRHAPAKPGVILDIGGAAGVYSFWLAEQGHEVHLIDPMRRLIEVAEERNHSVTHRLRSLGVGDARKLDRASASADLVLMLGPLYHLPNTEERIVALGEAFRVLRPGGRLIAAGISRFASALDGLSRELLADPAFVKIVDRDLENGHHRNTTSRLDYFTTAYFHDPGELRSEVSRAGFDLDALYGIEGPGWILPDFDARWSDPARREMLLRIARALETEPAVVGCSAHLLVVGRKPLSE